MADTLNVTKRQQHGSANCRRLRRAGQIPANLYGHGEENVNLTLANDDLMGVLRHGGRMVQLAGDVSESALIREVQWDAFGSEVLHVDLTRVSAGELVEVTLRVELRGDAPGTREGGIVEHQLHEVRLQCPVDAIPEKLTVSVNELNLGDSILASNLPLPEKATLLGSEDDIVVQCVAPEPESDEDEAPVDMAAEPEVIGRKAEDEEEE